MHRPKVLDVVMLMIIPSIFVVIFVVCELHKR